MSLEVYKTGEGPKIVLPGDKKEQFERKLKEYQDRISEIREKNPYASPERFQKMTEGDAYKSELVQELLEKGEVNTWDFAERLAKQNGFISRKKFNVAAAVIDDYCRTGGKHVRNGTGLR